MTQSSKPTPPPSRDSLSVEVGGWFKAHATGAGVIAIPLLLAVLAAAALAQHFLG